MKNLDWPEATKTRGAATKSRPRESATGKRIKARINQARRDMQHRQGKSSLGSGVVTRLEPRALQPEPTSGRQKYQRQRGRNPHRGGSSRTHIAAPKPDTKQEQQNRSRHTKSKREEYTAHTSCKTRNFSLTSTRFTIDPRRSPPSLPLFN